MAIDKSIDSAQLDADLASVADEAHSLHFPQISFRPLRTLKLVEAGK